MQNTVTPSGRMVQSTAVYDNFKYKIVETPKTLRLVETFLGDEVVVDYSAEGVPTVRMLSMQNRKRQ